MKMMNKALITILVLMLYCITRLLGLENDEVIMLFTVFNTVYIISIEERIREYGSKKRRNN